MYMHICTSISFITDTGVIVSQYLSNSYLYKMVVNVVESCPNVGWWLLLLLLFEDQQVRRWQVYTLTATNPTDIIPRKQDGIYSVCITYKSWAIGFIMPLVSWSPFLSEWLNAYPNITREINKRICGVLSAKIYRVVHYPGNQLPQKRAVKSIYWDSTKFLSPCSLCNCQPIWTKQKLKP